MLFRSETAKAYLPGAVIDGSGGSRLGIIAAGSADAAVQEARDVLLQKDLPSDYMRIRSLPFNDEVKEFLEKHEKLVVLDINRDGQLHQLLTLAYPQAAIKMKSLAHMDGLPLNARWVTENILALKEELA